MGPGVAVMYQSELADLMRALGNALYLAIDSIPLYILGVLFFVCALVLHHMNRTAKNILLPYAITTSPQPLPFDLSCDPFASSSKRHASSHSYFDTVPVSPRYTLAAAYGAPHMQRVHSTGALESMSTQAPVGRRGSRGRTRRIKSLSAVIEADEEV